jgi:hypothetical protein
MTSQTAELFGRKVIQSMVLKDGDKTVMFTGYEVRQSSDH